VPHPNDSQDAAIPVLNEVIVQGDPAQARDSAPEPADGFGAEPDEGALLDDDASAPVDLPMSDAIVSAKPARDAQGVPTEVAAVGSAAVASQAAARLPEAVPPPEAASSVAEPAVPAAQTHVAPEPSRPADLPPHVPPHATAPAASAAPAAAHPASAPAASPGITDYDANLIAERLRGRFAGYLTGEGRSLIEARCRDAFQEHTSRLVSQITREVSMALEMELTGWVREAIREELKHRGG
jgi:hypothetical protein